MPFTPFPTTEAMMGLMRATPATKPTDYPDDDPEGAMQLAFEQVRSEFPKETARATLKPMGGILRRVLPSAEAVAFPWGGIRYNPSWVSRDQATNADRLAHELTHVRQFQKMPLWEKALSVLRSDPTPYYQRPIEKEAFAASERRQAKRRDIDLPSR